MTDIDNDNETLKIDIANNIAEMNNITDNNEMKIHCDKFLELYAKFVIEMNVNTDNLFTTGKIAEIVNSITTNEIKTNVINYTTKIKVERIIALRVVDEAVKNSMKKNYDLIKIPYEKMYNDNIKKNNEFFNRVMDKVNTKKFD